MQKKSELPRMSPARSDRESRSQKIGTCSCLSPYNSIEFTYTARGQVETRTDETGIVDKFEYSSTNETLETATRDFGVGRLNLVTGFGYTAWGDVNSVTDPRSNETTFEFNLNRQMTKRIECTPFEFETNWIYNGNGWLITLQRQTGEVDPEFQEWNWAYNVRGDVVTITDPANNDLNIVFDEEGRMQSRIDAEGRTWQFQYDVVDRLTVVTDPRGNASETRTYTDNSLLASITDARNNTTEIAYDGHDRLDTRTYPDSTFEQMTYNQNSQVLTMLTRAGDTIENTYDVLSRLETRTPGSLPTQTMAYDLASRLTSVSTPTVGGDPSSGEFAFGFDTAGRLISQTMPDSSVVAYQLDENGNRIRLTWPDSYYVDYVLDELNRLTDIKLNGDSSSAVSVAYDALSRRTGLTYINGTSCGYGYAINNDLISLEHMFDGSSVAFAMGYNKVHQVTSTDVDNADFVFKPTSLRKTRYSTANNLNQYPAVNGAAVGYDNNGNLTSGLLDATFDPLNRITAATDGVVTNAYWTDPLNRQAQKEVDSTKTLFLHDGAQLIADYDDTPTLQNRYIPGAGLDEILIQISGSDTTFLHKDKLGSVIAQTDDTGAVLNKYVYAPFGGTPDLAGTVFGFTGQRYDAELGLYNYKARYYAPGIGRFLQPDPIGYTAGMSLYAYASNDALNHVDSLGLADFDIVLGQMRSVLTDSRRMATVANEGIELGGAVGNGILGQVITPVYESKITVLSQSTDAASTLFAQELGRITPLGGIPRTEWHSHPPIPGMGQELFSISDIDQANAWNLDTFLLTPKKWVLEYQGDQSKRLVPYTQEDRLGRPVGFFDENGIFQDFIPLAPGQYGPMAFKRHTPCPK